MYKHFGISVNVSCSPCLCKHRFARPQAKITDFGLHKRARYSRTEDVLMAVESEWSSRGGSVYHGGFDGGSVRAAGVTVLGGGGRPDRSVYGGSVIDGSYNGNAFGAGG